MQSPVCSRTPAKRTDERTNDRPGVAGCKTGRRPVPVMVGWSEPVRLLIEHGDPGEQAMPHSGSK